MVSGTSQACGPIAWQSTGFRHVLAHNRAAAAPEVAFDGTLDQVLPAAGFAAAQAEIRQWPGYAPTPLVALPGLAGRLGLGGIWYKDESTRFGLGSFKALGGAYAVFHHLASLIETATGRTPSAADMIAGRYRTVTENVTVATATDGNHGRSVAWGARLFGCRCMVYLHATVSHGREAAIRSYGAALRRTAGNYDDSVRQCAVDAAAGGWQVISDTSYAGYSDVPRTVMLGYGVMAAELLEQLPSELRPTHLFIQGGVGGLAAAVAAKLWQAYGPERPRIVVVEPENADCLHRSALAGRPTTVHGDLDTLMAGLAAGEVSLLAWKVLQRAANDFMTIPDAAAIAAMRALAAGLDGDPRIVGGEAGVGGLAGLIAATADARSRAALGLDEHSVVLLVGSEGDTDPQLYRQLVGISGEAVRAA